MFDVVAFILVNIICRAYFHFMSCICTGANNIAVGDVIINCWLRQGIIGVCRDNSFFPFCFKFIAFFFSLNSFHFDQCIIHVLTCFAFLSIHFSLVMCRYKKLLSSVDLTKDFFFSYSYNIMNSLQKNLCNNGTGQSQYESMFVWNHFLTRGIRNTLKNNQWTVALVYGFFKQVWYVWRVLFLN